MPVDTPTTTPEVETVRTAGLEDDQTPPTTLSVSTAESPTQMPDEPVTVSAVGAELMVTVL